MEKPLTLDETIQQLQDLKAAGIPGDAQILADTEARVFHVHSVPLTNISVVPKSVTGMDTWIEFGMDYSDTTLNREEKEDNIQ